MEVNKTLRDLLNDIIDGKLNKERFYLELGIVESVDEDAQTFVFIPNGGDAEDEVNMSVVDGTAFVIVPKVDTTVLIGYVDKSEKYCLQVKETDKIIFRGGTNGGLINIEDQVDKLNELVGKVGSLYRLLQTWTVVPSDGGLALKTAALLLTGPNDFNKSDFEDTNILH